jgi:hypothetical protein
MQIALWIVQALLAAAFLAVGSLKVFAYEKYKAMSTKNSGEAPGISKGLTTFIGAAELAGAVGLIVPAATGIAPQLTTLAALSLGIIMILAIAFHLRRGESFAPAAVLLLLTGFVTVGRMVG